MLIFGYVKFLLYFEYSNKSKMSKTRLFISNLPDGVDENAIRKAFSHFGEVTSLDLKNKATSEDDHNSQKIFAFVTLSASNSQIESCIQHFTSQDFLNKRLYVTRARESFLERLHRERQEANEKKVAENNNNKVPHNNIEKLCKKRKLDQDVHNHSVNTKNLTKKKVTENSNSEYNNKTHIQMKAKPINFNHSVKNGLIENKTNMKQDADKRRLESMKQKRKEFKEKQKIIKIGLGEIDKIPKNKKIVFSENEEIFTKNTLDSVVYTNHETHSKLLFENDEEDDNSMMEINFEMKEKLGQKVLELQSRYKSDKRFTLDDRFIEDDENEKLDKDDVQDTNEAIEIGQIDEKTKQLNILQEVLGVTIKSRPSQSKESKEKMKKSKIGMLRFDPTQPDHAKFLLPVENNKKEEAKINKKKKKGKIIENNVEMPKEEEREIPKVEVSKEQFYEISDTLKEAIKQPHSFSLRSMFARNDDNDNEKDDEQEAVSIPLEPKKSPKIKNPLDPGDVNPFKYDSSDSETEEPTSQELPQYTEISNVWKENLFFSKDDKRLKEGLTFFSKSNVTIKKERRDLKSIMKKRLYNKDRKNQMFQKKIGGRRKSFKKGTRRKN